MSTHKKAAMLIAAAPDMLAVLKMIRSLPEWDRYREPVLQAIDFAIEKAEGQ